MRLTLPAGEPGLSALRRLLVASVPELSANAAADLQLVATELVTNAYEHGLPPVRFTLLRRSSNDRLRVEVFDSGPRVPDLSRPVPEPTTPRGRGLLIVESISTEWGLIPAQAGKIVWAELHSA